MRLRSERILIWRRIILIGAVLGIAFPSEADWQYTRWGMSPAEVAEASSGTVLVVPSDEAKRTVDGDMKGRGYYNSGPYHFGALFNFNDRGLSQVTLDALNWSDCASIIQDLSGKYGQPISVQNLPMGTMTAEWLDSAQNNRIRLTAQNEKKCSIVYTPIRPVMTDGANGL